ncbi:MAG: hypothetical protein COY74_01720, partial [Nitrosopumilales archaeon CG_4_10_14_0_8_um_filter_34_8]
STLVDDQDGQFGSSIAGISDVGIVGIPNLVVGSPLFSTPSIGIVNRGAAYLYDGSALFASSGVVASNSSNIALVRVLGTVAGSYLGSSVSGIGDLDGDNVPDFMVSSPIDVSLTGAVFIFSSADFSELHDPMVSIGASLSYYAKLGTVLSNGDKISIAGMGDITGDGVPEVIVGLPGANTTTNPLLEPNGTVYIVSGERIRERINTLLTINIEM